MMDLEWHIRLVERLIKNNPDATIKDYYDIVDKEEENEMVLSQIRKKNLTRQQIRKLVVVPEPKEKIVVEIDMPDLGKQRRKRKGLSKYKRTCVV